MRRSPIPANFEIWRQAKGEAPGIVLSLDNRRAVIDTMAKLEKSEQDRGATTMAHPESMSIGAVGGFTSCTQQMVIVTNDGSGKPRYRMADAPSAHYWVEQVLPTQCDIENARYAKKIGA